MAPLEVLNLLLSPSNVMCSRLKSSRTILSRDGLLDEVVVPKPATPEACAEACRIKGACKANWNMSEKITSLWLHLKNTVGGPSLYPLDGKH
jgi:hypothetical protein